MSTSLILVRVLIQARVYSQQMTGVVSGLLRSPYRDSMFDIVCLLRKPFHDRIQVIVNDYLRDMSTISVGN